MNVTPTGIEHLKHEIKSINIEPPVGHNLDEFAGWLEGYAKCQADILDLIDRMYGGQYA